MDELTARQISVMRLVMAGYTTGEIAAKLGSKPKTVEGHRLRAFYKLGAYNAASAATIALTLTDVFDHAEIVAEIRRRALLAAEETAI